MKKIIFWNFPVSESEKELTLEEGIGTYKLTAIARDKGYEVEVFQGNQFECEPEKIDERTKKSLGSDGIIGISSFSMARGLLRRLSYNTSFRMFPIILGGPGATTSPREYLEIFNQGNPVALVQGDGETLFEKLIEAGPSNWHKVDGLWTYNPERGIKTGSFQTLRDMNSSPFADLSSSYLRYTSGQRVKDSSLSLEERIRIFKSLQLSHFETRRGCYYHCEFCSEPQLSEKGIRKMTPKRAVGEMEYFYSQFGITFFNFADNIAFDKQEWWHEFAHELSKSDIAPYITFGGYGTPKFFKIKDWFSEIIPSLADVGLSFITLGVQAGSKRILKDIIRRPEDDPENALGVVRQAIPLGVNVKTDFILGHPTETLEELRETYRAVKRIYDAGGQTFIRKLGVVPYSGYEIHLNEGRYGLPDWTPEFTELAEQILRYHGRKDAFKRVSVEQRVIPNIDFIDRRLGIRFPKKSMTFEELAEHRRRLADSDMPNHIKQRYQQIYELTIQSKKEAYAAGAF